MQTVLLYLLCCVSVIDLLAIRPVRMKLILGELKRGASEVRKNGGAGANKLLNNKLQQIIGG